jgi:hypothetical protein
MQYFTQGLSIMKHSESNHSSDHLSAPKQRKSCEEIEALEMARIIIDNSPVVLFRRVAGDDPKLTYVSENIRQFGYAAQDFLDGTLMFKEIVHPDDNDRLGDEIKGFAEQNIEKLQPVV